MLERGASGYIPRLENLRVWLICVFTTDYKVVPSTYNVHVLGLLGLKYRELSPDLSIH